MDNYRVLGNNVLVKQKDEEQHYGNIVLPDLAQEKATIGEVIAVGPGSWQYGVFVPTEVKEGEIVFIPKMGAMKIDIDGEEHMIIGEHNLLLIKTK